jgi:hypothetical protein
VCERRPCRPQFCDESCGGVGSLHSGGARSRHNESRPRCMTSPLQDGDRFHDIQPLCGFNSHEEKERTGKPLKTHHDLEYPLRGKHSNDCPQEVDDVRRGGFGMR